MEEPASSFWGGGGGGSDGDEGPPAEQGQWADTLVAEAWSGGGGGDGGRGRDDDVEAGVPGGFQRLGAKGSTLPGGMFRSLMPPSPAPCSY